MSDPTSAPPPMNDLPEGPHRDAEAGVNGRAVDDVADQPSDEGQQPDGEPKHTELVERRKKRTAGPLPSPEGFPMGADDGPMSEHHQWGDTAYGQAID